MRISHGPHVGVWLARIAREADGRVLMKQILGVGLAVLALVAAPAAAQATKSGQAKSGTAKSSAAQSSTTKTGGTADQAFAKEAAGGGLAEVALGNLAKQKASSADVKAF